MKPRGLTLLETLVTLTVMSLLVMTTLRLMGYCGLLFTQSNSRSSLANAQNRLYDAIADCFYHTSPTRVSVGGDGTQIHFDSARAPDGTFETDENGYPDWQGSRVLSLEGGTFVVRHLDAQGRELTKRPVGQGARDFRVVKNGSVYVVSVDWNHGPEKVVATRWTFCPGERGEW